MHSIDLNNFDTIHHKVYGEQYINVTCIATISSENSRPENYNIVYHRNPITGSVQSVVCAQKPEEETTENTLTPAAVQDLVWDKLQDSI